MKTPDFGDYVRIEQHRYGGDNEMYVYKVIGPLQSNAWVDVPVHACDGELLHTESADVVRCICCGVQETKVQKFRVEDVTLTTDTNFNP